MTSYLSKIWINLYGKCVVITMQGPSWVSAIMNSPGQTVEQSMSSNTEVYCFWKASLAHGSRNIWQLGNLLQVRSLIPKPRLAGDASLFKVGDTAFADSVVGGSAASMSLCQAEGTFLVGLGLKKALAWECRTASEKLTSKPTPLSWCILLSYKDIHLVYLSVCEIASRSYSCIIPVYLIVEEQSCL